VLTLALAVSCGPADPTPVPDPPRPIDVGVVQLVDAYRTQPAVADSAYTGRLIRVRLESYTRYPGGIGVDWGMPDAHPIVVFECSPPADLTGPVVVEGVCRGRVKDGRLRAAGVRWYLLVEGCTLLPQPPPR
jgi:hypothetical protein